jgi:hypothetical protein
VTESQVGKKEEEKEGMKEQLSSIAAARQNGRMMD